MPNFIVTDPTGQDHQVTAPDGVDDPSVLGFVKNMVENSGSTIGNAIQTGVNRLANGQAMLTGQPIVDNLQAQMNSPVDAVNFVSPLGAMAHVGGLMGSTFDTSGLLNRGSDLIKSKAEEYAKALKDAGVDVQEVVHSGSSAGPSSYIRITGQPDLRISGHPKGVFNSQSVIDIGNDQEFNNILSKLPKTVRKATPEDFARLKQNEIDKFYPQWLASADKKMAKGKSLTKSEQEAVDWRNSQNSGQQPWDASQK